MARGGRERGLKDQDPIGIGKGKGKGLNQKELLSLSEKSPEYVANRKNERQRRATALPGETDLRPAKLEVLSTSAFPEGGMTHPRGVM